MRRFDLKVTFLSLTAAMLLAGCAGGSPTPAAPGSPMGQYQSHVSSSSASALAAPATKKGAPYDIYVADNQTSSVDKIPRGCASASCVVPAATGFSCPATASLDKHGNLFVSTTCDYGTDVYELAKGCSKANCAQIEPGYYRNPLGIATDKSGNLYVAIYSEGIVEEVPSGCKGSSCIVQLGGDAFCGLGCDYYWDYGPTDVAVDKAGNVYVASLYTVSKMPPNCTSSACVKTIGGGWTAPETVSLDRHGNIYVLDDADQNRFTGTVKELPPSCGTSSCVSTVISGISHPAWAHVDPRGNVYYSQWGSGAVTMVPFGCHSPSCVLGIGGGFSQPFGLGVGAK